LVEVVEILPSQIEAKVSGLYPRLLSLVA
jgi:hypothetical protein